MKTINKYIFIGYLLTFLFFVSQKCFSQIIPQRSISGIVRDSTSNSVLPQATVSFYKTINKSLIKYQLNDARGRFKIGFLPLDTGLTVIVSYVGYKSYQKKFTLTTEKKELILPDILLSSKANKLEDVIVTVPPMIMRGDTLEFNASAFKNEKNDVVGDLIRKLPGFIIWGDGKITVNGKQVTRVTVEGKTFFANDPRIITQNLPTEVVDKIQVIPNRRNPLLESDSLANTVRMNVTLKKGKKSGLFGKIDGSYGSNSRYELGGMLAAYTAKDQLSITAGKNNVNKSALTNTEMMVNNSYKTGNSTDLRPLSNFQDKGITDLFTAGINYNRTWSQKFNTESSYTKRQSEKTYSEKFLSNTLLDGNINNREAENKNRYTFSEDAVSTNFNFHDSTFNQLSGNLSFGQNSRTAEISENSTTKDISAVPLNSTQTASNSSNREKFRQINLEFNHYGKKSSDGGGYLEDFKISYSFYDFKNLFENKNVNRITFRNDSSSSFNRRSYEVNNGNNQRLFLEYSSLGWLLGAKRSNTDITFENEFTMQQKNSSIQVDDFDINSNFYSLRNKYLTNDNDFKNLTSKPAFRITKTLNRLVAGRYSKSIVLFLLPKLELIRQDNSSSKSFRNIKRDYSTFIPTAEIILNYAKTSISEKSLSFSYQGETAIPYIDDLSPLVDSSQLVFYRLGNINLQKSFSNIFSSEYSYKQKKIYGWEMNFTAKAQTTKNFITDSSYYDSKGIRTFFATNVDGYRNYGLNATVAKPFKLNKTLATFQLTFNTFRPFYLDGNLVSSKINGSSIKTDFAMTVSSSTSFRFITYLDTYNSKITGNTTRFSNTILGAGLQTYFDIVKNLSLQNTFNYSRNYGVGFEKSPFLWNLFASYRLGASNQFELKASANDILNQNIGITSYINGNTIGYGQVTKLQRFVSVGVSYYPRYFGSIKK